MIELMYMKSLKDFVPKVLSGLFEGHRSMSKDNKLLDLPNASDFISDAPEISLAENIRLCEQMLHVWNSNRTSQLKSIPIVGEEFYL